MEGRSIADADPAIAAANLIAGQSPPDWLPRLLSTLAGSLKGAFAAQADFPNRAAISGRLDRIKAAAEVLAAEFSQGATLRGDIRSDAAVLMMQASGLDHDSVNAIVNLPGLMRKLASAAEKAAGNIPKRQGRDKAMPNPGAPSPHVMCALMVTYCWNKANGTPPPPTSQAAQSACEALWGLANLSRISFGNNLTGWRPHLETVRQSYHQEAPDRGWYWHTIEQLDLTLNPPK